MHASITRDVETPIGRYTLAASESGLTHVQPAGSAPLPRPTGPAGDDARRHLEAAARALAGYFAGTRRDFDDLVLAPGGSAFQRQVWEALRGIPFGSTASYGEVARRIERPRACRAVGSANRSNPLGIVVPCHRVIGADGSSTGYAGGLERKRWLLEHEAGA